MEGTLRNMIEKGHIHKGPLQALSADRDGKNIILDLVVEDIEDELTRKFYELIYELGDRTSHLEGPPSHIEQKPPEVYADSKVLLIMPHQLVRGIRKHSSYDVLTMLIEYENKKHIMFIG